MPLPIAGGSERDRERVEYLIWIGDIPREAVERAEQLWRERLQFGVEMPNGELATVALTDFYHLIQDNRIWRKPERIELLLRNVFEIRTARVDRHRALSDWHEDGRETTGYGILTLGGDLISIHLVDERELRRLRRQGERLWP